MMTTPATTFRPALGRLVLLYAIGLVLVVGGLFLLYSPAASSGPTDIPAVVRVTARIMSVLLLLVGTPLVLFLLSPLYLRLRAKPTLVLMQNQIVLKLGFTSEHRIPWTDIDQATSTRVNSILRPGWVTIVFNTPRPRLGRELSLPDLYLDAPVEDVAQALDEGLEHWRFPFGRPGDRGAGDA